MKGREGGQDEWGLGHDTFTMGRTVTKALFGDSGRRRQEGGVNTTISQMRDAQQRCQRQRQCNRQQHAGATKGQEGGATIDDAVERHMFSKVVRYRLGVARPFLMLEAFFLTLP